MTGPIHVFVDNSNFLGGAQRAVVDNEDGVPWIAVRVYYRNLFYLVERGRTTRAQIMAGSVPPGNDDLWDYAHAAGYATDLLRKVELDNGKLAEQAVDEMLHLKMANAVLKNDPPQTMVIVTGDGKVSNYGTSFPDQAEEALKKGWNVEVWSWKSHLSKAYSRLPTHRGGISIRFLDPFRASITSVKGGIYRVNGVDVQVPGRVVAQLA